MAFFILIYVGYVFCEGFSRLELNTPYRVEVTLGGWIVTYIIEVRGGGPSSGYISSGFFGGLTFGRVALLWVNSKVTWLFVFFKPNYRLTGSKIGERRAIFLYSLLALG